MLAQKAAIVAASALFLTGCGLARQQEAADRRAAANASAGAAIERCNQQFRKGTQTTAMARARCLNAAAEPIIDFYPNPELSRLFFASRLAIAERYQAGHLTEAQAEEETARRFAEMTEQANRRSLAGRAVAAQEANNAPVSCTKIGNTVSCF